jgi:hypothetical protein
MRVQMRFLARAVPDPQNADVFIFRPYAVVPGIDSGGILPRCQSGDTRTSIARARTTRAASVPGAS